MPVLGNCTVSILFSFFRGQTVPLVLFLLLSAWWSSFLRPSGQGGAAEAESLRPCAASAGLLRVQA